MVSVNLQNMMVQQTGGMGNFYKAQPAGSIAAMQGVQSAQIQQCAQCSQKNKSRQYMQSVPNFRASDYGSATAVRTQLQTKSEEKKSKISKLFGYL